MYLISKRQAIPVKAGDKWDYYKLFVGRKEVRIVLRVKGRRYLLYHTQELAAKYSEIGRAQFITLCDEIIAVVSDLMTRHQEYIDFDHIAKATACRHQRRWRDMGLIFPTTPEHFFGYPTDPKTEQLISRVRVDMADVIIMDDIPPADCKQEELPF